MLSLLQPFAVRFAVRMAGFIDKYKRINPQTAVNMISTAENEEKLSADYRFYSNTKAELLFQNSSAFIIF